MKQNFVVPLEFYSRAKSDIQFEAETREEAVEMLGAMVEGGGFAVTQDIHIETPTGVTCVGSIEFYDSDVTINVEEVKEARAN